MLRPEDFEVVMPERIVVKDELSAVARTAALPLAFRSDQVHNTRDLRAYDYVFDASGMSVCRVAWSEDVPLDERLRVMKDLVDLYTMRLGGVT